MSHANSRETRVLLTGASGRLAGPLRPALARASLSVRLLTRSPLTTHGENEEVFYGELEDLSAMTAACDGVSTVIHLGGISDEAPFDMILDTNIVGTYNIFEAARRSGVHRIVYASTHHVTGFYPTELTIDETFPPRPDTVYAVSKLFGETLGRLYHDKWGIEVICLRLGACSEKPADATQLCTWLSTSDCTSLLLDATENPVPDGYCIVYGVSRNTKSFWKTSAAGKIGYIPRDSSDVFESQVVDEVYPSSTLQGGRYTTPTYLGRRQ